MARGTLIQALSRRWPQVVLLPAGLPSLRPLAACVCVSINVLPLWCCAVQEDSSVTEKRAAVRDLYDKIKMAIDDVQYKQEKIKRKDHEGDNVRGPAGVIGSGSSA